MRPRQPPSNRRIVSAMRGLTHRWILRDPCAKARQSSQSLTDRVLASRGIVGADAVDAFCNPKLARLHDPSAIPDLDLAAKRLLDAITSSQRVAIWGDYDVDGITASAILHHTIHAINPDADTRIHIPHRIDEGYGLNDAGVRQLAADGVRLIVSVDCGITAINEAKTARSLGVDLVITDHHTPPASIADLPDAYAVVHPGRTDSTYPHNDLCGASVAYKLAWRLATLDARSERVCERVRRLLVDLLPLAALGTIADVVPLLDENRIIARFGLSRIKSSPFVGLSALIEASGLAGEKIGCEDVGFRLAPRLNAAGRMGCAHDALELLLTDSPVRAAQIAQELTVLNDERRAIEKTIADQAAQLAQDAGMTSDDRRAIVLAHRDWHPGVVGIVCSRLVRTFGRPTILLCQSDGVCHGSGRSIDGFDLHAALGASAQHLTTFGGHAMAAGLSLDAARLDEFTQTFINYANEHLSPADLTPSVTIDCQVDLDDLSPRAVSQLQSLGPFGRCNTPPKILVRNITLVRPPQPIGAGGRHLSLHAKQGERTMRFVAWGWGEWRAQLHVGQRVDVVVEPKLNTWRGVTSVEPQLADLSLESSG